MHKNWHGQFPSLVAKYNLPQIAVKNVEELNMIDKPLKRTECMACSIQQDVLDEIEDEKKSNKDLNVDSITSIDEYNLSSAVEVIVF